MASTKGQKYLVESNINGRVVPHLLRLRCLTADHPTVEQSRLIEQIENVLAHKLNRDVNTLYCKAGAIGIDIAEEILMRDKKWRAVQSGEERIALLEAGKVYIPTSQPSAMAENGNAAADGVIKP